MNRHVDLLHLQPDRLAAGENEHIGVEEDEIVWQQIHLEPGLRPDDLRGDQFSPDDALAGVNHRGCGGFILFDLVGHRQVLHIPRMVRWDRF